MPVSLSQQVAQTPTKKIFIGYGDDAIYKTLQLMKKIITSSANNYYVRRWAEKIISENSSSGIPLDDFERVNIIYKYIRNHTNYIRDTHGFELLKTPPVSLQLWELGERPMLDCDCLAMLSLSLLKSIGYPVALRATGYRENRAYTHVYGLVQIKSQWYPIDLTAAFKDYPLGWEAPNATVIHDEEVIP